MKKKLMALLLSLTMVVTLIPAMSLTAFADDNRFVGGGFRIVLILNQYSYTEGDDLDYCVYAENFSGYKDYDVYLGTDYELQYRKRGGSWKTLYDARYLTEGNYELIAQRKGNRFDWAQDPASDIAYFSISKRRHQLLPLTIYAPTLYINVGDEIPNVTYRYTVTGLDWGDDVDEVLDFEPTLKYATTPSNKKAGTYTITFRGYPDVNFYFDDKYYIAGYMEGSLVVRDNKSDNEKAFETYRTEKAKDCDKLYVTGDSSEIRNIAINAKANILNSEYNKNLSLQKNCDVVYTIYNNAATAIKKLRDAADEAKHIAEVKAIKPEIDDIDAIKKGAKIHITKDTYDKEDGEDIETYQIARATSKNGTYKRVKTVTNTDSHKRTITASVKNLKSGKKYFFKVRGVVTLNGEKVYTKWSTVEAVKAD